MSNYAPPENRGWANYFRYGVSKAVFNAIDSRAWGRIMRWLRRKYKRGRNRIGMPELRRRFCDQGWRFACNGAAFTGASSVTVSRYRYRGKPDSHAVDPQASSRRHNQRLTSGRGTRSARCGENRTPGAGRRPRETAGGDTGTAPWADLTTHVSAAMTELIEARDWLTVYQLPPYAHELNPVEMSLS